MRRRLKPEERRQDILKQARLLFFQHGFTQTEMEDIRRECGISRGGLYHHFGNKDAILAAIIGQEVSALARLVRKADTHPIAVLLEAGSAHLGQVPGVIAALATEAEKLSYLTHLDQAFTVELSQVLAAKLVGHVKSGVNPAHIADLFLTVNAHINRRTMLGDWDENASAAFAATALSALRPFMQNQGAIEEFIEALKEKAHP